MDTSVNGLRRRALASFAAHGGDMRGPVEVTAYELDRRRYVVVRPWRAQPVVYRVRRPSGLLRQMRRPPGALLLDGQS